MSVVHFLDLTRPNNNIFDIIKSLSYRNRIIIKNALIINIVLFYRTQIIENGTIFKLYLSNVNVMLTLVNNDNYRIIISF